MRPRTDTDRQTDTQTRVTTIHFSWSSTHAKCNKVVGKCTENILEFTVSKYTVSQKNVPPVACCNFDAHEWILIFFGRNVTHKVGNQKTLYNATSNNLCICTTWQNGEARKSHISLNWTVLHTMHLCAKKKLSCVMCLIASNICSDSKISH